jgi:hypothetical protein
MFKRDEEGIFGQNKRLYPNSCFHWASCFKPSTCFEKNQYCAPLMFTENRAAYMLSGAMIKCDAEGLQYAASRSFAYRLWVRQVLLVGRAIFLPAELFAASSFSPNVLAKSPWRFPLEIASTLFISPPPSRRKILPFRHFAARLGGFF